MNRTRHTLAPLIAYHGCDKSIAEAVLAGRKALKQSENEYDWLGPGIYFWVDSPERGLDWAKQLSKHSKSRIKKPAVIGAFIYPGLCLNLTDYGVMRELADAYQFLADSSHATKVVLPRNSHESNGILLRRSLDCAVIKTVHQLREDSGADAYDTVYGVFEEGAALYSGAGFKERTHVQIAVRNTDECVLGYFRVTA